MVVPPEISCVKQNHLKPGHSTGNGTGQSGRTAPYDDEVAGLLPPHRSGLDEMVLAIAVGPAERLGRDLAGIDQFVDGLQLTVDFFRISVPRYLP